MFCRFCGNENSDNAKFCRSCGKELYHSSSNIQSAQPAQPAPVQAESAPVNNSVDNTPAPQPPKKKKSTVIIAIIVAVIIALSAAGGVIFFTSHGSDGGFLHKNSTVQDDKHKDDDEADDEKAKKNEDDDEDSDEITETTSEESTVSKDIIMGFIFLGDESSTTDKNFLDAAKKACKNKGVEYIVKTNINETDACYTAAAELAEQGCSVVFANSFGHENYLIKAAEEYPDVQFCHASGTRAHTEGLKNYHNAFAAAHEGRYLTGVAAGLKLNEMIKDGDITSSEAKMGFVATYNYAEVISSYTAFYLGARSVCPSVTMEVFSTNSWYDTALEKEAAKVLIANNCVLISQYSDSFGAPEACEEAGVPDISYNGSVETYSGSAESNYPDTNLISLKIDWTPYFEYIIDSAKSGKEMPADWTGTVGNGSVILSGINEKTAAAGTEKTVEAVKADLAAGKVKVFDLSTFTVDGNPLSDDCKADVDTDNNFTPDTKVIKTENGIKYFAESEFRSAPYFDIQIDGITPLN